MKAKLVKESLNEENPTQTQQATIDQWQNNTTYQIDSRQAKQFVKKQKLKSANPGAPSPDMYFKDNCNYYVTQIPAETISGAEMAAVQLYLKNNMYFGNKCTFISPNNNKLFYVFSQKPI